MSAWRIVERMELQGVHTPEQWREAAAAEVDAPAADVAEDNEIEQTGVAA